MSMSDDPDELKFEQKMQRKDPARVADLLEAIDSQLRYGIPALKGIGWVLVVLLGLILWRVW